MTPAPPQELRHRIYAALREEVTALLDGLENGTQRAPVPYDRYHLIRTLSAALQAEILHNTADAHGGLVLMTRALLS